MPSASIIHMGPVLRCDSNPSCVTRSNSHPLFLPPIPFFLKLLRTLSPFSYATAQNNLFGIRRFHTLCPRNRGVSARLLAHSALREERCVLLTSRRSVQCLGASVANLFPRITGHGTRATSHAVPLFPLSTVNLSSEPFHLPPTPVVLESEWNAMTPDKS